MDTEYEYEGQVDKEGKAFGKGKAKFPHPDNRIYEGTFLDSKPHGFGT